MPGGQLRVDRERQDRVCGTCRAQRRLAEHDALAQRLDLLERDAAEIDPDGDYLEAVTAAWSSDDLVEGRRAFGERRPAEFEGR